MILKVNSLFSFNQCGCKRTNYLIYCGATRGKIQNRELLSSVEFFVNSDGIPYRYILSPVLQYDKNLFPYFISVSGSKINSFSLEYISSFKFSDEYLLNLILIALEKFFAII